MMAGMRNKLSATAHKAVTYCRLREKTRRQAKEFQRRKSAIGVQADWKDFLRARAQIDCSVAEYFAFELFRKDEEARDSYLTWNRQQRFIRRIGDVDAPITIPGSKTLFNVYFEEFLQREWINPTAVTPQQFLQFVKRHGAVIIKPSELHSGAGIVLHRYESDEATLACHYELYGSGAVVEQLMVQHEQMNRLNPHCVNSVRVTTYTDRDDVHILLATARSAAGDGIVDNFGAGGLSVAVDKDTGVITADGVDQEFRRVARHPLTGTRLKGFQIPNWDKALDVVRRAARKAYTLPQCRWVGWDLGFLANDEVAVIEGNWRPGPLAQNTHERGIYHELLKLTQKR